MFSDIKVGDIIEVGDIIKVFIDENYMPIGKTLGYLGTHKVVRLSPNRFFTKRLFSNNSEFAFNKKDGKMRLEKYVYARKIEE